METSVRPARINKEALRRSIQRKYREVATDPDKGFHFHTGYPLAAMLGYRSEELGHLPAANVSSFAGTGNPFAMGRLREGEAVLDVGCGSGVDTLLAALQVGPSGSVVAIDMTQEMLERTAAGAAAMGLSNVVTHLAFAESLPVDDACIDVVISNGVLNLTPDKEAVMREIWRVLKPGGRVQMADIVVHRPIDEKAKENIELWSG